MSSKWVVGLLVVYTVCMLIASVLAVIAWLVSFSDLYDDKKMSSFECGFISFQGARLVFSLQFFLVAMIFLVFDVEIALILPLPVVILSSSVDSVNLIFFVFVLVVLGGLYYEWSSGMLDWVS